jgi:hypothetical protein
MRKQGEMAGKWRKRTTNGEKDRCYARTSARMMKSIVLDWWIGPRKLMNLHHFWGSPKHDSKKKWNHAAGDV